MFPGPRASGRPVVRIPTYKELGSLIIVYPFKDSKSSLPDELVIKRNFPMHYVQYQKPSKVAIFVTLPTVHGIPREFCLTMETSEKRAAQRALRVLKKLSTIIKPKDFFRRGKINKIERSFIENNKMLTKSDTGNITPQVAHQVLKTFIEEPQDEIYFDKGSFTRQEKLILMEVAGSFGLRSRKCGHGKLKIRHVCIYKKQSKHTICEDVLLMGSDHPTHFMTQNLLKPDFYYKMRARQSSFIGYPERYYGPCQRPPDQHFNQPDGSFCFDQPKISIENDEQLICDEYELSQSSDEFDQVNEPIKIEDSQMCGQFYPPQRFNQFDQLNKPIKTEYPQMCGQFAPPQSSNQFHQVFDHRQRPDRFDQYPRLGKMIYSRSSYGDHFSHQSPFDQLGSFDQRDSGWNNRFSPYDQHKYGSRGGYSGSSSWQTQHSYRPRFDPDQMVWRLPSNRNNSTFSS